MVVSMFVAVCHTPNVGIHRLVRTNLVLSFFATCHKNTPLPPNSDSPHCLPLNKLVTVLLTIIYYVLRASLIVRLQEIEKHLLPVWIIF